jgi:hypothetical protein
VSFGDIFTNSRNTKTRENEKSEAMIYINSKSSHD